MRLRRFLPYALCCAFGWWLCAISGGDVGRLVNIVVSTVSYTLAGR